MAAGREMLPAAPVPIERAVIAEQQMTTGRGTGTATWAGQATGHATGQADGQPQRIARRSAGGRWLVWLLRAFVWVILLLIGYRGIAAIVTGYASPGSAAGLANQSQNRFPVALAEGFALEFGQVYLNFSPATVARRASELAPFLPAGASPQLGWNGNGSQTVRAVQIAGIDVRGAHSAVVKLLALTSGRIIEIGVPVYYSDGGIVVSGQPAYLPVPPSLVLPAPGKIAGDKSVAGQLRAQLPAFFRAFAGGDTARIDRFAAPGARLSGLNDAVGFGRILRVTVPATTGTVRQITVTVAWIPASGSSAGAPISSAGARAEIDMTYAMAVVRRGGRWYVRSIAASTALPRSSS